MSEDGRRGFLDTVATAFLRRRLYSRRLRAAAVRGLRVISSGADGGLQMDFDLAVAGRPQPRARRRAHAAAPADPRAVAVHRGHGGRLAR
jgi:hypothetical protein